MSFLTDLRFSRVAEEAILEQIRKLPIPEEDSYLVANKTCDVEVKLKIEIKRDRRSLETGNVIVEIGYNGNPSGLSTTEASVWIWCLGEKDYWFCWTEDLKEYIGENPEVIYGGDGKKSKLVKIKLYDFISKLARKIEL